MTASIEHFRREQIRKAEQGPPADIEGALDLMELWCDRIEERGHLKTQKTKIPQISTRALAWMGVLGALILPLFPLDELIGTATAYRGPAVGFHEAHLETLVVRAGDPFVIKTKSQYLRVCSWKWTLEWRRAENGRPIAMEQHYGSGHTIGELAEHDIALRLPTGIKPGNYILHESATGECGRGEIAQIIDPDMPFTVKAD